METKIIGLKDAGVPPQYFKEEISAILALDYRTKEERERQMRQKIEEVKKVIIPKIVGDRILHGIIYEEGKTSAGYNAILQEYLLRLAIMEALQEIEMSENSFVCLNSRQGAWHIHLKKTV